MRSEKVFNRLVKLYERNRRELGEETACGEISKMLEQVKSYHKRQFKGRDHEQSWRASKGRIFEKLVFHIIEDKVKSMGLGIVGGSLKGEVNKLSEIKRNLLVDFHKWGHHLPDADLIIYNPKSNYIYAIISVKVTLRERIAQTGYWKMKLLQDDVTKHINCFFITLDQDGTLATRDPAKKSRAIVEVDTDGGYVMSENEIEESPRVKSFDKFLPDLEKSVKGQKERTTSEF